MRYVHRGLVSVICSLVALINCQAAIIVVQSKSACATDTQAVVTFDSSVTVGNYIIIGCTKENVIQADGVCVASDDKSNTYTLDKAKINTANIGGTLSSTKVTTGGTVQIKGMPTGLEFVCVTGVEVSGLATTSAKDTDAAAKEDSSSAAVSTGVTGTRAQADEILIGLTVTNYAVAKTIKAGSGFTLLQSSGATNTAMFGFEYKIVSSAGTDALTFTLRNAGDTADEPDAWAAMGATYKQASSGGSTVVKRKILVAQ